MAVNLFDQKFLGCLGWFGDMLSSHKLSLIPIQALGIDTEEDVHKLTAYFIMHQQPAEAPAADPAPTEEALMDAPFTVDTDKQV